VKNLGFLKKIFIKIFFKSESCVKKKASKRSFFSVVAERRVSLFTAIADDYLMY
jgi:hypothetical protein